MINIIYYRIVKDFNVANNILNSCSISYLTVASHANFTLYKNPGT